MLLYEDVLTNDEMFSDAFPVSVLFHCPCNLLIVSQSKLVDNIVYEVDCQLITIKEGDVDIGVQADLQ
jgi:hypothetical protein